MFQTTLEGDILEARVGIEQKAALILCKLLILEWALRPQSAQFADG
jgi:hypothetical protein